ncbi:MAG: WecB/TagA/CpsF family glycosyltransferase [Fimbriimonadaceae bacterium]|nr:WecB/TagA/CpsF family glycosyltransferase [Chitinophagales bacterium]
MLKRTKLFDLDFINDTNFDATIASMLNFKNEYDPEGNKFPLLFTPNVDDVVKLNEKRYADLAEILKRSYYLLPDGQPIIWASKLLNKKLGRRLPGSEFFPLLWKEIIKHNKRIMVVAPNNEVGELLKKEYPALEYYVPPFFDVNNKEQLNNVIEGAKIVFDKVKPEYVFIGIRFPKQNHIALGLVDHVKNLQLTTQQQMPLFLLMGASYEFYLNLKKRAPKFWQKIGMEWFYRFTQEPGRLFKRYFIDDMKFIPIFFREMRKK